MNPEPEITSSKGKKKEVDCRVTPFRICVLILIKEFLKKDEQPTSDSRNLKNELGLFLIRLLKTNEELSFQQLSKNISQFKSKGVKNIQDLLKIELGNFETPDELYDFMADLELLIKDPLTDEEVDDSSLQLGQSSLYGIFVRRMNVGFHKLTFDSLSRLYDDLRQFIAEQPILSPTISKSISHITEDAQQCYDKYMHCVQIREYEGALDYLHRYFDHFITQREQKSLLPYSALSLAILHYHFGHTEEAMEAIREAMRLAQERNDNECLAYSLSWIFHLTSATPSLEIISTQQHHQQHEELLQRVIARAKKLNLPHLAIANFLSLAKHTIEHESSVKSHDSGSSPLMTVYTRDQILPDCYSQLDVLKEASGVDHLLRSSAWELLGNPDMVALHSQLQIQLSTSGLVSEKSESTCLAYCKLAQQAATEGDYERALQLLENGQQFTEGRVSSKDKWLYTTISILFQWALYRNDLNNAELLYSRLKSLSSPPSDIHLQLQTSLQQALLLEYQGCFEQSLEILHDLTSRSQQNKIPFITATAMLRIADIHMKCDQPTISLHYILSCISLCDKHQWVTLQVEAHIILAEIMIALNEIGRAEELLGSGFMHAIIPQCSPVARGNWFLARAKCLLALVQSNQSDFDKTTETFNSLLESARDIFYSIEVTQSLVEVWTLWAAWYSFDSVKFQSVVEQCAQQALSCIVPKPLTERALLLQYTV